MIKCKWDEQFEFHCFSFSYEISMALDEANFLQVTDSFKTLFAACKISSCLTETPFFIFIKIMLILLVCWGIYLYRGRTDLEETIAEATLYKVLDQLHESFICGALTIPQLASDQ